MCIRISLKVKTSIWLWVNYAWILPLSFGTSKIVNCWREQTCLLYKWYLWIIVPSNLLQSKNFYSKINYNLTYNNSRQILEYIVFEIEMKHAKKTETLKSIWSRDAIAILLAYFESTETKNYKVVDKGQIEQVYSINENRKDYYDSYKVSQNTFLICRLIEWKWITHFEFLC